MSLSPKELFSLYLFSSYKTDLGRLRRFDASIKERPPVVDYKVVISSDDGLKAWINAIRTWGFCLVDGCPPTSEDTQALIEQIAFIRNTHYGGFWRFTSDLASKDSAYTRLALACHTDTTYFTDPAGLQTFHLLSHTEGEGGASLLVDGFRAAEILRSESPEDFRALCEIKIRGHSSGNEGIAIMPERAYPVITTEEIHPKQPPRVSQIRWNNDDRAAMTGFETKDIERFYRAARKLVEILRRPESEYWLQLEPGLVLSESYHTVLKGQASGD
ncbi:MAG: hypothetical protein LQ343_001285 [Gyalolechia ehrenbergii]|nr:MAG: hypothetical protein LQ343_001285 [Gyalolechia ehrenbergii]